MKAPDWLVYVLILIAAWVAFGREDGPAPAGPAEVPAEAGELLPGPSPFDSAAEARAENVRPGSTGTAFAIGDGLWLTARHVVRGCPLVGLTDTQMDLRVRAEVVHLSRRADLAILRTAGGPRPLSLDLDERDLRIGESGFHIGYPQGRPGEVESVLMGREQLFTEGDWRGRENTLVWAETGRSRGLDGSLGGLSGGPVFDANGEVLGITIAESPRRGRVITTAADTVLEAFEETGVPVRGAPVPELGEERTTQIGRTLRSQHRILRVVCFSG